MRHLFPLLPVFAVAAGTFAAAPASAQTTPPPVPAMHIAAQAEFNLRGHLSAMVSGGWDLDVIGDVTAGALGMAPDGQQFAINPTAYPDVFAKTPTRRAASIGFGIARRTEVFARYTEANYTSARSSVGAPSVPLVMKVSNYREKSYELGLRHYFATGLRFRRYVNFAYGQRRIDAISATFTSTVVPDLGELQLYSASRLPSMSVEFGMTIEVPHAGIFIEGGARWQKRLKRNDADLAPLGAADANNTGARFYMPVQVGVVFRI